MYRLIKDIAERCYTTAEQRNQDVSCLGCLQGLQTEFMEYWAAIDANRSINNAGEVISTATALIGADLAAYYDQNIHNTDTDELADILIVAATWTRAAELSAGEEFNPDRSMDVLLASGAIQFICSRITGPAYLEELRAVVNLKMSYNEIRND